MADLPEDKLHSAPALKRARDLKVEQDLMVTNQHLDTANPSDQTSMPAEGFQLRGPLEPDTRLTEDWTPQQVGSTNLPPISEPNTTLPWPALDNRQPRRLSGSLGMEPVVTPAVRIQGEDTLVEKPNSTHKSYITYYQTKLYYVIDEFINLNTMSDDKYEKYLKVVDETDFYYRNLRKEAHYARGVLGKNPEYLKKRQDFIRNLATTRTPDKLGTITTDSRTPEDREIDAYVFGYKLSYDFARQYLPIIKDHHSTNMIDAGTTPFPPPNVDIRHNLAKAIKFKEDILEYQKQTRDPLIMKTFILPWFHEKVKNGAEWDFKKDYKIKPDVRQVVHPAMIEAQLNYQNFGNYHYGIIGAALGISEEMLLQAAGFAQHMAGTNKPEWGHYLVGPAPYGDQPEDQEFIKRGIEDYKSGKFALSQ